jgi:ParB-like chromosome segregation protein Spo0J
MSDLLSKAPVESWPVENLIPYENNNKKHPDSQVALLANSISEDGLNDPIVVEEDGTIISGHGRRLAILKLGWTHAPVRVARGLTKTQARKLRIAVNKTASNEYDTDALQKELADLQAFDINLASLGFSEKELTMFVEDVGEIDIGSITDDVVGEVEKHDEAVKETAARIEDATVPIAKAFGFKNVPVAAQRTITRFMGVIEDSHGKQGLDALLAHMEEVVSVG